MNNLIRARVGAAPSTIVSLLSERAERQPDRLAYRFLHDGEQDQTTLTYAEIDRAARAVAVRLKSDGLAGERAVLLYPPGPDYLTAVFGCLLAGVVAVPAYPPDPARMTSDIERLEMMIRDARPAALLTNSVIAPLVRAWVAARPADRSPRLIVTDDTADVSGDDWQPPTAIDTTAAAFIQYTSGSTTAPRGVVITHDNLMHNSAQIQRDFGHTPQTVAVAWLPPYHDMGLIGGIIQPLFGGFPITLMSPVHFLQRPRRWLEAVTRFGATTSGGPNFAYDLCVSKITAEERAGLELGRWQVAFNGAEPIRQETLQRFAAAFAPVGFRPHAFHPCYGLAEATLLVTGGVPWAPTEPGSSSHPSDTVSCGRAADDQQLVIVDSRTSTPCPDGEVGEIWVSGPSVAPAYWTSAEGTASAFGARLADYDGAAFLRTGDLGFIKDGELYVTGRVKDVITVRGRNHYPQDIEWTVGNSSPELRPGRGAAFGIREGERELVVVAWERARDTADDATLGATIAATVREAVARDHGLRVDVVVLLPPGRIPKTSSGKIQRSRCAARYRADNLGGRSHRLLPADGDGSGRHAVDGTVPADATDGRRTGLLAQLRRRVAEVCAVSPDEVVAARSLMELGADSLTLMAIGRAVEEDFGVAIPVAVLASGASLDAIADRVAGELTTESAARSYPLDARPTDPGSNGEGSIGKELKVSQGQRSLWFLQQLAPDRCDHNVAVAMRLRGRLDLDRMRSALITLRSRHDVLRTRYPSRDGDPVALPDGDVTDLLGVHDVAGGEPALAQVLGARAGEPFDPMAGPLLRAELYRLNRDENVLLLAAHHLIMDFWSLTVLIRELEELYAGDGSSPAGVPGMAPAVGSACFADVIAWSDQQLTGERGLAQRRYWTDELQDSVPTLQLVRRTSDTPRRAATCHFRFDAELTGGIRRLAATENVTTFMVLLAAYELLLHRYTGQPDLLVGVPMAGRESPGFEDVVGYCMNPVAIRSQLTGTESVREVLSQVQRRVTGALDHQTFPLHLLPSDRPAGSPPFDTLFAFNQFPARDSAGLAALTAGQPAGVRSFGGLQAETVGIQRHEAAVGLHLSLAETPDAVLGSLHHQLALVDEASARRMMRHFESIVRSIVADVQQRSDDLAMLDPRERALALAGWSTSEARYEPGETVAALIERQAAATPDAIAVVGGDEELTFRELDDRASRLARLLIAHGLEAGARIGLCLDRSPDMIVALVAALKTGAAYVPADPGHPSGRIATVFADAGVTMVLTQPQLVDRMPAGTVVVLVGDELTDATSTDGYRAPTVSAGNPAYVMSTSGSTGRPKSVVVSHDALAHYVRFAADHFEVTPADRVLQFASLSFDASAQQIFVALTRGATLVLRNDWMLSSPEAFTSQCEQWSISVLDLPTAYWHELVTGITGEPDRWPSTLRLVIIGGERAAPGIVADWCARMGGRIRLINNYGPTEATIVAVTGELSGFVDDDEVPIGHPLPGTTAVVLDRQMQPVPPGVVGNLHLGGVGLAYGYHGRPALTAQSFIAHPFGDGQRLYRTGDLASFDPDGTLVYRGRADRQLKLRGYRVEPAEIESALRRVPSIANALVVMRSDPQQLVGYVVPAPGERVPDTGVLRGELRRTLPEFMIPSTFVGVSTLPLNHHGKIDPAGLPVPMSAGSRQPRPPATPFEEFLVDAFADILEVSDVGVDDDFFDRGGHSLLATRLIARIKDRFAVDLPLRAVFESPTPAGLSRELERGPDGAALPPGPEPRSGPLEQPVPLSFVQERIWFLQQLEPASTNYNVPRALRMRGPIAVDSVRAALAALQERHEILRTTFPDVDGEPIQRIHPADGIPLTIVDHLGSSEESRDSWIRDYAKTAGGEPFDLARGPLIRVTLVRLAPDDHALVLVEHHLLHDGWAQGVFLRDFIEHYQADVAGRAARLPELPIQYADFALWQRRTIRGAELEALLDFWRDRLAGAPQMLGLRTTRPRPPVLGSRGGQEILVLDEGLANRLRALGHDRGATLFMVMFAAFTVLLHGNSRQHDIVVGTGVANRQRPELENILGMIINTILLRTDVSGHPSFAELVDRVRHVCLDAYAHQDMPFERLVEELGPERSLSHTPLFQVMFSFLDTPSPSLRLPELTLQAIDAHNGSAKFDLNVVIIPDSQRRFMTADGAGETVTVLLEYNLDLFDASDARELLRDYQLLLNRVADDPQALIDTLLASTAVASR